LTLNGLQSLVNRVGRQQVVIVGTGYPGSAGDHQAKIAAGGLADRSAGADDGSLLADLLGDCVLIVAIDDDDMFHNAIITPEALMKFHQHVQPIWGQPGGSDNADKHLITSVLQGCYLGAHWICYLIFNSITILVDFGGLDQFWKPSRFCVFASTTPPSEGS
jgi:hypothetical protein